MKKGFNTIAFLAIALAIIFGLALVLPQASTGSEASNAPAASTAVSELSAEEALGAIILVRQVRVSKKDKEETQQVAYVDQVLSRYE